MGNAYTKLEKWAEAVDAYNKSLTEHRTKDVLDALKKVEKIKEEKERTAYIDPEKSKEARERGNELFKSGKFPDAIKEYSEAIKRNPSDATLYTNRAAAYTKLAAYPEGIKDCEDALKLDPKFGMIIYLCFRLLVYIVSSFLS
jgi:stress-induced-phosphoprotein 1